MPLINSYFYFIHHYKMEKYKYPRILEINYIQMQGIFEYIFG